MIVYIASPNSFCAGVERAIDMLDIILNAYGAPIYVFHQIVHNRDVISGFEDKGAVFVDSIAEIPNKAKVVLSAHGVSDSVVQEARSKQLHVFDATCPLVLKVHLQAKKYLQQNYDIILIGRAHHDEVMGITGDHPEKFSVVVSKEEIDALPFAADHALAYLTQTTLSVDETRELIEYLKIRFPGIRGPRESDICYATQNRQEAIKALLPEASHLIVFGSDNSSNGMRLAELGRQSGVKTYYVDTIDELQQARFQDDDRILLSAAASTAPKCVDEAASYFEATYGARIVIGTHRVETEQFQIPAEVIGLAREKK